MTPRKRIVARLIYRDGLMLVIDKPPGFAVHKGPERRVRAWRITSARCASGCPRAAPRSPHRLDRDTSGCLVLGRPPQGAWPSWASCSRAVASARPYWAVVEGGPAGRTRARIDLPLGPQRTPTRGWWDEARSRRGQPSVTTLER